MSWGSFRSVFVSLAYILEMLDDSLYRFIVFNHFLMVASALLMRTSSNELAHYSIQMPFSSSLPLPLNNLLKFDQEFNVFLIFLIIPMGSGIFLFCWRATIKAIYHLFGFKNPRLKFSELGIRRNDLTWLLRSQLAWLGFCVCHSGRLIILLKLRILLTFKIVQILQLLFTIKIYV